MNTTEREKLLAVVVEPMKVPVIKEIESDLKGFQDLVGGYIQAVYPYDDPVAIVCNDEGKLDGLPLNRALRDDAGTPYDVIAGTFAVVGLGAEDFTSLSPELAQKYSDVFKTIEAFAMYNGQLVVVPISENEANFMTQTM